MRDLKNRLALLERHQRLRRRRTDTTGPVTYAVYREGEPRPDVNGPVYCLVAA